MPFARIFSPSATLRAGTSTLALWSTLVAPAQAQAESPAQTRATSCATVEIQNVRPRQGHLMIAAFNAEEGFGKKPLVALRVPAGDEITSVQLCGLSGKDVALTLFQDLDSDGKMGRNLVGIPTEPWGSSGEPGSFGPSWSTGKVALDGRAIVVKMSQ